MVNRNSPFNVLAAVQRVHSQLSSLVSKDDWDKISGTVKLKMERLRESTSTIEQLMLSVELMELLAPYPLARERLSVEIEIQAALQEQISSGIGEIAKKIGFDTSITEVAMTATYCSLLWSFDSEDVPPLEELQQRQINILEGGVSGGQSVKFRNLHLNLGEMSEIAASAILAGFSIADKPHWLIITASALLTIRAIQKAKTVKIDEQEASVFWGFIQALRDNARADDSTVNKRTNEERQRYGLSPLSQTQFQHSVKELETLGSIELVEGNWHIIEDYKIDNEH